MTSLLPATDSGAGLSGRVRRQFGRRAADYERHALLQRAVAAGLARLCRDLPLPAGPCADLGAGSGLLSRALGRPGLLQLDLCPALLERNPLERPAPSGISTAGCPGSCRGRRCWSPVSRCSGSTSLPSSWPTGAAPWPRGAGWLWRCPPPAASPSGTGLPRPPACPARPWSCRRPTGLLATAASAGLALRHGRVLRFSRTRQGGLATLRHLQRLGAGASRQQAPDRPGSCGGS